MEKGKARNEKKYISIILVPHFSDKVKAMKLSALYSKVIVLFISVVLITACLFGLFIYSLKKSNDLSNEKETLKKLNAEQQKMLMQQNNEIGELVKKDNERSEKEKDFNDKYKEITDNFINGRSNSVKANRGDDSINRTFTKDIAELRSILEGLNNINQSQNDSSDELSKSDSELKAYIESLPTFWPVHASISSEFGGRRDPLSWSKSFHEGLDLAASYGVNIRAAGSGKVIFAGRDSVYGKMVIIDHGHGITTMYGHTSKLLVNVGQVVKKGEVIAKVGSTGRSTGAHLHFGIYLDNEPVNPLKYLE